MLAFLPINLYYIIAMPIHTNIAFGYVQAKILIVSCGGRDRMVHKARNIFSLAIHGQSLSDSDLKL